MVRDSGGHLCRELSEETLYRDDHQKEPPKLILGRGELHREY